MTNDNQGQNFLNELEMFIRVITSVSKDLAYNIPILLLDIAVVITLVGSATCHSELVLQAIFVNMIIAFHAGLITWEPCEMSSKHGNLIAMLRQQRSVGTPESRILVLS